MHNTPQVSVVIASYNAEKTVERCLLSLKNQITDKTFEIIAVDSSMDNTPKLIMKKFPEVRLYTFPERRFPGDARNFGVSVSSSKIIAFIDTDCIADKNWIDEILRAHQSSYPVIGGAIANGNPDNYISWAAYFCEFSQWMPRLSTCYMDDIPTCCLSVKRWVFEKYGPFLEGTYSEDTAFNWRLTRDRLPPLFVPSIKISHINIKNFGVFLRKEFVHGRYFARVRIQEQKFSGCKRMVFAFLFPVLPFVLFSRTCKRMINNKIYLKYFILASPLVFIGLFIWALGELLGYVSRRKRPHP